MNAEGREQRLQLMMELANSSPFYRFYEMEIVEIGEGTSRLVLPVKEELTNLYGIMHGGALAALLDSSCSFAIASMLDEGETMVTLDMRVNFTGNVSQGVITGRGKALHRGKTTGVANAELRDDSGVLLACGMSTCYIRKYEG